MNPLIYTTTRNTTHTPMRPWIKAGTLAAICIWLCTTLPACGAAPSNDQTTMSAATERSSDAPLPNASKHDISNDSLLMSETIRSEDKLTPDKELLTQLMGEEDAQKLITKANYDDNRLWIATHPEEYAMDGETVQGKLLKLAANDDAAVAYVREFPDRYPSHAATGTSSTALAHDTAVPHLYQWDQRWGYTVYSSTAFGLTGCCPTAFAMAYQGVTGNTDLSPYDMGVMANEMGYMDEYQGTNATFLLDAAPSLGMQCIQLPVDSYSVTSALEAGNVIVVNVGNGHFSSYGGHFMVMTGLDEGRVVLNDPYSVVRSAETWNIDFILNETIGLYAFSPA